MSRRVCAYALCDRVIPEDAPSQRRFCRDSHRVGAYKRREAAELRRLRDLVEIRSAAA